MIELSLTMLCPPELEEKLLDTLLLLPEVEVFTSTVAGAHGVAANALSAAEQVMGRAVVTQVQVLLAAADRETVLDAIQREFAGTGLRYWFSAVMQEGVVL